MKRRALIVGGTGTIGREVAHALAPTSDLILVHRNNLNTATNVTENLQSTYPSVSVETIKHTVDDHSSIERLAGIVGTRWQNGPEVLVCCFGDVANALLMTETYNSVAKTVNEHLMAVIDLCHSFVGSMYRNRFGRIVCVGSISSQYVKRGQVAYCAATAGLEGMTRALALEVAGRGVTVNVVKAGLIAGNSLADHQEVQLAHGRDLKKLIPVGRLGDAKDVARAVSFLCADSADFITGTSIVVDGGRSLGDANL